jgi:hypothetical protein
VLARVLDSLGHVQAHPLLDTLAKLVESARQVTASNGRQLTFDMNCGCLSTSLRGRLASRMPVQCDFRFSSRRRNGFLSSRRSTLAPRRSRSVDAHQFALLLPCRQHCPLLIQDS